MTTNKVCDNSVTSRAEQREEIQKAEENNFESTVLHRCSDVLLSPTGQQSFAKRLCLVPSSTTVSMSRARSLRFYLQHYVKLLRGKDTEML